MLSKQPDTIDTADKLLQAGNAAEKQMAFYLHRAFGEHKDIRVLNGIRLAMENDICQIDIL